MSKQKIIPITLVDDNLPKDLEYCSEVSFELFTVCNLKCDFCIQTNTTKYQINKLDLTKQLDKFETILQYSKQSSFAIEIFGGELFASYISDDDFEIYHWFINEVWRLIKTYNKTIHDIHITTNLVYPNVERVIKLAKDTNVSIFVSFDLVGRFKSQHQIDTFMHNLQIVANSNVHFLISVVLTKPNILAIINQQGYYNQFMQLYDGWSDKIYFEGYDCIDQLHDDVNYTSQQQYGEFLVWCYNHMPKLTIVTDLIHIIDGSNNRLTDCCRIVQITNTDDYWQCTNKQSWTTVRNKFIANKQCMQCPWFRKCGMMCYRRYCDGNYCAKRFALDYIANEKLKN